MSSQSTCKEERSISNRKRSVNSRSGGGGGAENRLPRQKSETEEMDLKDGHGGEWKSSYSFVLLGYRPFFNVVRFFVKLSHSRKQNVLNVGLDFEHLLSY